MKHIRVRFAPSPTGYVHVGSLRTALYNYLFAKHHDGKLILRIEDTDQTRYVEGAVENLLDALRWSGINYDEGPDKNGEYGPYYQSERLEKYSGHVRYLMEKGNAYPCFCTAERLEKVRKERLARNEPQGMYDGTCRNIPVGEASERMKYESHIIRLKVPEVGETVFNDHVRGTVHFQNNTIDDQVLLKSDGFPTYHLANVVDDHLMGISHVIRGEEWLPSTPKHVLLYRFFGWELPEFAHLPLLLNPDRSKLSKRQGDVSVKDYRRRGILPQALLNFVVLLGWSPGDDDKEIFSMDELIAAFSLERINKSGAVFDKDKLEWMNGVYIRDLTDDDYVRASLNWFLEFDKAIEDTETNRQILLSLKDRINLLSELKDKTGLFFNDSITYYSEDAIDWLKKESSKQIFEILLQELDNYSDISLDIFKEVMKIVQNISGIKGKELWMPVRAAITGMTEGPELPVVIQILGKDKVKAFLLEAIKK